MTLQAAFRARHFAAVAAASIFLFGLAVDGYAADVTLTSSDPGGQSSFNSGARWSDLSPPSPGNNYFTNGFTLRTPEVGNSSFAGDSITIDAGTLASKQGFGATVTITTLILDGGTLAASNGTTGGGTQNYAGNLVVASDSQINLLDPNRRRLRWIGGTLTGSGNVSINGKDQNDLFFLEGTNGNSHTGNWTVNNARLIAGGGNAIGDTSAITLNGASTSAFDVRGDEVIGSLAGNGEVNAGTAGSFTLTTGANNTSTTYTGVIEDNLGTISITKTGSGNFTLGGNSTYSGLTRLNQGNLIITSNNALGSTSGGTIIDGSAGPGNVELQLNGVTISEPLTMISNGSSNRSGIRTLSGVNVLNGDITLDGSGPAQFFANAGTTMTINGNITRLGGATINPLFRGSGTGNINGVVDIGTGDFIITDGATWNLNSIGHTWSDTVLARGTLNVNVDNALPSSSNVQMGQSGGNNVTFNIGNTNQTIASVNHVGTGTHIVRSTGGNLTITGSYTDATAANSLLDLQGGTHTIGGGLTVDSLNLGSGGMTSTLTVNSGTVNIGNGTGDLLVGRNTTVATNGTVTRGTLDLSAANSVNIDVDQFLVGTQTGGSSINTGGVVTLSNGNNVVSANTLLLGDSPNSGNGGNNTALNLGTGINTFNVDSFTVGGRKTNATVSFVGPGGVFNLSGNNNAAADLIIADNDAGTGSATDGIVDLTGGTFNATIDELRIGRHRSGTGNGQGVLRFDAGTVTANTVVLGQPNLSGTSDNPSNTTGTIEMNGGSFSVNGDMIVGFGGGTGIFTANGGTVSIGTGAGSDFLVGRNTTNANNGVQTLGTVDLQGASSVSINVDNFLLGTQTGGSNISSQGIVRLSNTLNNVIATNLTLGDSPNSGNTGVVSELTLGGGVNNFQVDTFTIADRKSRGLVNINPGGSFSLIGTGGAGTGTLNIGLRTVDTGANATGTLDLTNAANVFMNVNQINLGTTTTGANGNSGGDSQGIWNFANGTNNVFANTITVGDSPGVGNTDVVSQIHLGTSTNNVNVDTLTIGGRKSRGSLDFSGPGGVLILSGNINAAADFLIGYNNTDTGTVAQGDVDLTGGTFNANINALRIGRHDAGAGGGQGTLTFGAGTVNANSVILGEANASGSSDNPGNTTGEIVMNGGTFNVSGSLTAGLNGGDGSFTVNGGNVSIGDGSGSDVLSVARSTKSGTGETTGSVNLQNADSFTFNGTEIQVGVLTSGANPGSGGTGSLRLSDVINNITASSAISIGDSPGSGNNFGTNQLTFGAGTNIINTPTIVVGGDKSTGLMDIAAGGSLQLANGGGRTDVFVGQQQAGTSGGAAGTLDLRGGTVNAMLDQLVIGSKPNNATGNTSGQFFFDAGTINANSLDLGLRTNAGTAGSVTGTAEVSGTANLIVNGNANIGNASDASSFTLAGNAVLDFADHVGMAQANNSPASTLNIATGSNFNFTSGTLMDATTIDPSSTTAGNGGVFTQGGGRFVVGRDGAQLGGQAVLTTVLGDFTQTSGLLALDIVGSNTEDIDMLMADTVNLNGQLDVTATGVDIIPWNWYTAVKGDTITVGDDFGVIGDVGLYRITFNPNGPGQVLQVAIPEPASVLLWLMAIGGFAAWRRRRLNK